MPSIRERAENDGGGYHVGYYSPHATPRAKTFKTKRDAVEIPNGIEADMSRGAWTDPKHSSTRVEDFVRSYLDSGVHWRPNSRIKVQGHLQNYVLPAFGNYRLSDLRPQDV